MQSYSVHGSTPAAICCARSLLQQRRVSKKTLVIVLQNLGESADQLRKQRSAARPSRAAQGAIHKMVPRGCGIPAAADVAFPPRRGGTRRARHTCAFTRARRKSQLSAGSAASCLTRQYCCAVQYWSLYRAAISSSWLRNSARSATSAAACKHETSNPKAIRTSVNVNTSKDVAPQQPPAGKQARAANWLFNRQHCNGRLNRPHQCTPSIVQQRSYIWSRQCHAAAAASKQTVERQQPCTAPIELASAAVTLPSRHNNQIASTSNNSRVQNCTRLLSSDAALAPRPLAPHGGPHLAHPHSAVNRALSRGDQSGRQQGVVAQACAQLKGFGGATTVRVVPANLVQLLKASAGASSAPSRRPALSNRTERNWCLAVLRTRHRGTRRCKLGAPAAEPPL